MIRFVWGRLRGPVSVRFLQMLLIVVGMLVALFFVYEWIGATFLDPGGTIG